MQAGHTRRGNIQNTRPGTSEQARTKVGVLMRDRQVKSGGSTTEDTGELTISNTGENWVTEHMRKKHNKSLRKLKKNRT